MGGEGAQWIGMAPFITESHIFQNLGDGTFFHSGHLAVRAAISSQVSMTFKILWNDVSAMTGGQHVEGSIPPLDVARMLLLEGVKQVVITTEDPSRYRGHLPKGVSVRPREDVVAVQSELARVGGVTVMIHDQACATELRRARKRGRAPLPTFRVVINERVCEGCGDCQTKSNCLSLQTIDTDFGPKTRIDEGTCNVDLSCLAGDCPAFTLVEIDARDRSARALKPEAEVLAESPAAPSAKSLTNALTIRVAGIGGTGVVTAAHLLARAAMLDGLDAWGLDQTGLSQKAGPVVSDLRIGPRATDRSNIVGDGEIDLLIAADLMAATQPSCIAGASSDRTTVVGSSTSTLSGPMILGAHDRHVPINELASLLASVVKPGHSTFVDAEALAVKSSGTASTSNVVLLGVAYQLGVLPLTWSSLVDAVVQFGVAVEANLAALEAGREWVDTTSSMSAPLESDHSRTVDPAFAHAALPDAYRDHITALAVDLRDYQSLRHSDRYLSLVELTWTAERQLGRDGSLANAVADGYFKLLAYKDEYEVARLLLSEPKSASRTTWLLHPPLLRSMGLKHKIHLGPWARPIMKSLRAGRRLRETPLDPFGRTRLRRTERELHREYADLIASLVPRLTRDNVDGIEAIARLPLQIRGYEDVKMQSIVRYRASLAERLTSVTHSSQDAAFG
jgi:indolepyruvate ferredoxin oxidoreductase